MISVEIISFVRISLCFVENTYVAQALMNISSNMSPREEIRALSSAANVVCCGTCCRMEVK